MLEKKVVNGKTVTNIDNLQEWDKNPRFIEEKDFARLKRQIENLGLYKAFLVTELGIVIGGNMRLRACRELVGENKLSADVPINEIAFAEEEKPTDAAPEWKPRYKVVLDGKLQEKYFETQEQAMIEYAISDNDAAGRYDTQALAELIQPYEPLIPLEDYKLELGYPVTMESFIHEQSSTLPPEKTEDEDRTQALETVSAKFTPEDWKSKQIAQRIESARTLLSVSNDTDFVLKLIEFFEDATQSKVPTLSDLIAKYTNAV